MTNTDTKYCYVIVEELEEESTRKGMGEPDGQPVEKRRTDTQTDRQRDAQIDIQTDRQ